MRWVITVALAGPLALAAIKGPDTWFQISFGSAALVVVLLALFPLEEPAAEPTDEMPPFMTTEQVLAYVERQRAGR